jgi:hypothetical protein
MKTPMQQLFEEMKEKGFFIAEYIKRPALEREAEYVSKKYQEGYEQGKEDKVTEMFAKALVAAEGNREEFYEKELKRYNTGLREWPIKRDYPTIPENKNQE